VTVPVDPIAVALAVTRALDALGIVHTIGGSIAGSIAGEPRSTIDIHVVAALRESRRRTFCCTSCIGTGRVERHPSVNGATSSASSESRHSTWFATTCE
jgi:hypothetical protein